MLDARVLMSSACANAPRKRPLILRPRDFSLSRTNSELTRLKRVGERTEPWRIPLSMLKGTERE